MNKQNQNPIIPRLNEALGRELAKSGSQDAQQPRRGHQPTPAKNHRRIIRSYIHVALGATNTKPMKRILIACEESQRVCIAFRKQGFEAYSCDIQPCGGGHPEWHIQGNVLDVLRDGWHAMIGHPPCTYLSYAGQRSWNDPGRITKRLEALEFFRQLWEAPIEHICLENPKSIASPIIKKYDQEIQPWHFGDGYQKTTWLWLKNLPKLKHSPRTLFSESTYASERLYYVDSSKESKRTLGRPHGIARSKKDRSRTFQGIANAMAEQWGNYLMNK